MRIKFIFCLLIMSCYNVSFSQDDITNTNIENQPPVSEQEEKKPKFWIGPKFGLDISSQTKDFKTVQNSLSDNYQAGILVQYGRVLYIQPEFYYASQKVTTTPEITSLNSIRMPVMAGLRFLNLGLFSLHVTGGPVFDFKLKDADKFTNENRMTWQVGAGVDILGFITTDLRYTLRPNVSVGDQVSQFSTNPSVLNLTVGLKLR